MYLALEILIWLSRENTKYKPLPWCHVELKHHIIFTLLVCMGAHGPVQCECEGGRVEITIPFSMILHWSHSLIVLRILNHFTAVLLSAFNLPGARNQSLSVTHQTLQSRQITWTALRYIPVAGFYFMWKDILACSAQSSMIAEPRSSRSEPGTGTRNLGENPLSRGSMSSMFPPTRNLPHACIWKRLKSIHEVTYLKTHFWTGCWHASPV